MSLFLPCFRAERNVVKILSYKRSTVFFFENSQPTCITYIWNHYVKINGSLHALRPRRNHAVKLGPYYDSLRVKSSLLDCVSKIFFNNVIDLSKWCYNLHITMWKIIFMKTTFFIWKKNPVKDVLHSLRIDN